MGQGAVFPDKDHTDQADSAIDGNLVAASGGLRLIKEGVGTPNIRYRLELDTASREIVTGKGGLSTVKIYEKAEWDALEADPEYAIVAVFDKTTSPTRFGTYYISEVHCRYVAETIWPKTVYEPPAFASYNGWIYYLNGIDGGIYTWSAESGEAMPQTIKCDTTVEPYSWVNGMDVPLEAPLPTEYLP